MKVTLKKTLRFNSGGFTAMLDKPEVKRSLKTCASLEEYGNLSNFSENFLRVSLIY